MQSEKPERTAAVFPLLIGLLMCRAAERRERVGGKQGEVLKRVGSVFQRHLASSPALHPGRWRPLLSVTVSVLSLETIQLTICHRDCITQLHWQPLTHTLMHRDKSHRFMHTHKHYHSCPLDCSLWYSPLNTIEKHWSSQSQFLESSGFVCKVWVPCAVWGYSFSICAFIFAYIYE